MGSIDQVDDRTFRVNFTGDGVDKLRDRVNDKLKEFMGDYTDDTLVVSSSLVLLFFTMPVLQEIVFVCLLI